DSRRPCSAPPRREVTPVVWFVWRVLSVGPLVLSIDLGASVAGQQSCERLVDERRVVLLATRGSSSRQEVAVHRGADPHSCHAMIMPRFCYVSCWHGSRVGRVLARFTTASPRPRRSIRSMPHLARHPAPPACRCRRCAVQTRRPAGGSRSFRTSPTSP